MQASVSRLVFSYFVVYPFCIDQVINSLPHKCKFQPHNTWYTCNHMLLSIPGVAGWRGVGGCGREVAGRHDGLPVQGARASTGGATHPRILHAGWETEEDPGGGGERQTTGGGATTTRGGWDLQTGTGGRDYWSRSNWQFHNCLSWSFITVLF